MTPRVQWINRHGWLAGIDLEVERRQAAQEGRDLTSVAARFDRLLAVRPAQRDDKWFTAAGALTDRIQALPCHNQEPSAWPAIQAARPKSPGLPAWRGNRREYLRRLHGGLLGRICGCMLGKPVEGQRRNAIRRLGQQTGNWPLRSYLRGRMHGAVEDDDINYTVTAFAIVERYGAAFTPQDVASFWIDHLPLAHTCTAERVAYRNFAMCLVPPASATYRNPYREWIGAQIRADYFGYANPGNPARAAAWAWRDASISHIKNGIYGALWIAAMLAAAYVADDWVTIIRAGLAEIPARSRLAADIEKILAAHLAGKSYAAAVNLVHRQWDERCAHDWCHTNSNAQIVAIGLLWGEDDFAKTITRPVMAGFDTDCNAATCGSLWGIKHGVGALPKKWTRPLHNTVRTGVTGYHQTRISDLAEAMVATALRARTEPRTSQENMS